MAKKILIILGIACGLTFTIGITYAWFTWEYNTKISGESNCFDVVYTKGRNIGDSETGVSLIAGSSFDSGISSSVIVHLNEECSVSLGKGTLYINTEEETSDILITSGALKYQIIDGNTFSSSGTITSKGPIVVHDDFDVTYADRTLMVIVWLDKSLINETNETAMENAIYKGYITLDVESRG